MLSQPQPKPNHVLIDPSWSIVGSDDAPVFKHEQDIPSDFLSGLSDLKMRSAHSREGNYMKLCSVPVAVAEKWLREGFDMHKESAKAIVARLRKEDLSHFITTAKSF